MTVGCKDEAEFLFSSFGLPQEDSADRYGVLKKLPCCSTSHYANMEFAWCQGTKFAGRRKCETTVPISIELDNFP